MNFNRTTQPRRPLSTPPRSQAFRPPLEPNEDGDRQGNIRSIRLVSIKHYPQHQTAPVPIHPRAFPPFLLVLLAWRYTPQPSTRRVVVRAVIFLVLGLLRGGGGELAGAEGDLLDLGGAGEGPDG